MKIEQHIAQLLYRHQCVTIPGFGAFLTEIQSAQFNEVSCTFYPPKKSIIFNALLKNNDGLLANHIALQEKIDYETAIDKIKESVDSWKLHLENNLPIMLHNIGIFSSNSEGNIIFEAFNQVNYLTESFGLSSFISPAIKREILLQQQTEETSENETEETPISIAPQTRSIPHYMRYAAILVAGLSAIGFISNHQYEQQIAENTRLVQTEVQKEVQTKIQEATFYISNPLPNVTLTVKNKNVKKPYHIMAGSFRDEANAKRICKKLIQEGYEAKKLNQTKFGLYPVIYGSYDNYAEAQKVLNKINKSENPEAWLLIKDL